MSDTAITNLAEVRRTRRAERLGQARAAIDAVRVRATTRTSVRQDDLLCPGDFHIPPARRVSLSPRRRNTDPVPPPGLASGEPGGGGPRPAEGVVEGAVQPRRPFITWGPHGRLFRLPSLGFLTWSCFAVAAAVGVFVGAAALNGLL
jgi:hypothetical protein